MKMLALLAGTAMTLLSAQVMAAERGTDGQLNILYWQAASTLNPYLSGIAKEVEAASLVLEPLARFDEHGKLVPWLAKDIPTVENGGFAKDLKSITWKLKDGIKWSDGSDMNAADVVFTWKYCTDPEGGCAALSYFDGVTNVEAIDQKTVKISFSAPKPYPYTAFVGSEVPILQEKQFENCTGTRMSQCSTENLAPIGTGPYKVDTFAPNDVTTYSINENYREADKPAFSHVMIKGGGDPAGAARAVLQTGETDYAWNLQLGPDILSSMADGGTGNLISAFGSDVEYLFFNQTNPDPELGEKRSTKEGGPHPFLADPRVAHALSMAIDRQTISDALYANAGKVTCNVVAAPEAYASHANDSCANQDLEGARKLLDEAGWKDTDGDGIRDKNGVPLKILFQTSTNGVRQDTQSLIKEWWKQIGVETELKNVAASVFFGNDPSSPDTRQKFFADVEMYTDTSKGQDPEAYLDHWTCNNWPRPQNQWQGDNIQRFCNTDYDKLAAAYRSAVSLEERTDIAKKMNDILVQSYSIVPLVHRGMVSGKATTLAGVRMSAWDSQIWNIADWHRVPASN